MRGTRTILAALFGTFRASKRLPDGQDSSPSRATSFGLSLLLGFAALHLLWLAFGWGGDAHRALLGNVLFVVSSLAAALAGLTVALKHRGKARRGWLLVSFALAAQVVGNGIWAYLEHVPKIEVFPSAADFFYLLFGPFLAAGLWQLMPSPRDRLEGSRLALDLAITVGAVGLYFWRFLLAPPLSWGADGWVTGISMAYPLLDLLLLGLLLLIVMRERRGEAPRLDLLLLGIGVAVQIGVDLLYSAATAAGTYYTGHPMDGLWTLSTTLYVGAAYVSLKQRRSPIGARTAKLNGFLAVTMPYLAVAAGLGLHIATQADPAVNDTLDGKGVLYGAVAVTLLVIARQLLAFSENWRLAQQLEVRVQARTAELEALSNKYRYDALHDALTGLPNRTHFQLRLGEVAEKQPFAVLYLDFDRFKGVNDSFGHAVGDALLRAIATRLQGCLRPGDLVARLGGDEFAVLLLDPASEEDAVGVAERLIQTFAVPFEIDNHTLYCTSSIGVVLSEAERSSPEDVLRDADIAMYRAKAAGRSRFVLFEAAMRENVQARLALETDLRGALQRDELEVYYQPVMHSDTGSVAGFEALVRWQHPERGLVSPGDFIPLAEETGLVIDLDRWVLKTACAQLRDWSADHPELSLSVNLSGHQFSRPDLAPFVAEVLAEFELAPERLKLELTEGLLMDTSAAVRETLTALRLLGLRLHIDDFGTGYSSLSYLQRFDADALKVDRSFVLRMLENEDSAELVRTVVSMAHNMGMQVVAEGVETQEQYRHLQWLGCEYVQGYLFSKPVPARQAEAFLQSRAPAAGPHRRPPARSVLPAS
jgi:diguanylate cyclase